tara:strand:- start:2092 stop:2250 length:159 start_codon:yes stop_codon:yes gene_type:complete
LVASFRSDENGSINKARFSVLFDMWQRATGEGRNLQAVMARKDNKAGQWVAL